MTTRRALTLIAGLLVVNAILCGATVALLTRSADPTARPTNVLSGPPAPQGSTNVVDAPVEATVNPQHVQQVPTDPADAATAPTTSTSPPTSSMPPSTSRPPASATTTPTTAAIVATPTPTEGTEPSTTTVPAQPAPGGTD